MKKDNFITEVIFRKEKEGDILALFPYDIANFSGAITGYSHLGQHCAVAWEYVTQKTKPAKGNEYNDLKIELESLGYDLRVIKRRTYKKYLQALYEVRESISIIEDK